MCRYRCPFLAMISEGLSARWVDLAEIIGEREEAKIHMIEIRSIEPIENKEV